MVRITPNSEQSIVADWRLKFNWKTKNTKNMYVRSMPLRKPNTLFRM